MVLVNGLNRSISIFTFPFKEDFEKWGMAIKEISDIKVISLFDDIAVDSVINDWFVLWPFAWSHDDLRSLLYGGDGWDIGVAGVL